MNIKLCTDPKTFLSSGPSPDVFSGLFIAALQKYAPIDDVVARRVDEDPPARGSAAVVGGGAGPLAGRGGGFGAFLRLRRWASCRLRRRGHCFHHLRGRMRRVKSAWNSRQFEFVVLREMAPGFVLGANGLPQSARGWTTSTKTSEGCSIAPTQNDNIERTEHQY